MPYSTRPWARSYSYSNRFPSGVKWLLISNIALFLLYFFAVLADAAWLFKPLQLTPADVVYRFHIWQLVTYQFLHDPFGVTHILFNMLMLYWFGPDLERTWGTERFLKYYFLCGIGAGICIILLNLLLPSGNMSIPTIGASGALYGILLAFGMTFPDSQILFMFLFPLKAKYVVMIYGAIAFLSTLGATGSSTSHIAHLGGMIFGFLYLQSQRRVRFSPMDTVRQGYKDWKVRRAKRKFQVYLKKRDADRDRWVH